MLFSSGDSASAISVSVDTLRCKMPCFLPWHYAAMITRKFMDYWQHKSMFNLLLSNYISVCIG